MINYCATGATEIPLVCNQIELLVIGMWLINSYAIQYAQELKSLSAVYFKQFIYHFIYHMYNTGS
jgi:hypothetical protein